MNGEIVSISRIDAGILHLADGRAIDTAKFRDFTHGYAVTSHASQSKTVDHVIVAAERLGRKIRIRAACSRGRYTCTVHTPDKAALLDRLPSGNREAALDMLKVELTRKKALTHDRWGFWTRAKEHFLALFRRLSAKRGMSVQPGSGKQHFGPRGEAYNLGLDALRRERGRHIEMER